MEFFKIINKQSSEEIIHEKITPDNLEKFTESMFLLEKFESDFISATIWGEFLMSYDKINGGVRFALLDCPNALQWTITTGFLPDRNKIVLHATINQIQKPKEFLEEVEDFMNEWEAGLISQF